MLAVVATQYCGISVLNSGEAGRHGLVASDAFGIAAFHEAYYLIGKHYGLLLHYVIFANGVNDGCGGYERYTVYHILGKLHIGNFDNTLFA
jgi:hypothetical protein